MATYNKLVLPKSRFLQHGDWSNPHELFSNSSSVNPVSQPRPGVDVCLAGLGVPHLWVGGDIVIGQLINTVLGLVKGGVKVTQEI